MKPTELSEAIGFALGALLPDLLRNLDKVRTADDMHDLFSSFLAEHIAALRARPDASSRTSKTMFEGIRRGVDAWRAHTDWPTPPTH